MSPQGVTKRKNNIVIYLCIFHLLHLPFKEAKQSKAVPLHAVVALGGEEV
jgi:hypothetical protein